MTFFANASSPYQHLLFKRRFFCTATLERVLTIQAFSDKTNNSSTDLQGQQSLVRVVLMTQKSLSYLCVTKLVILDASHLCIGKVFTIKEPVQLCYVCPSGLLEIDVYIYPSCARSRTLVKDNHVYTAKSSLMTSVSTLALPGRTIAASSCPL